MNTNNEKLNLSRIAKIGEVFKPKDFNKEACFNAFEAAINNGGQLDDIGMAKLYRHFMPTLPAKPKNDFQWVAQAMAVKDVRYYLNFVYSDGKRLMATDGHRAHIIKDDVSYEPGFYDKNGTFIHGPEFAKFPDIDRIIPKTDKLVYFNNLEISADLDNSSVKEYTQFYEWDDLRVCSKYLKQACQYFDDTLIKYKDKNTSVLIEDQYKMAIVMPMRK